MEEIARSPLVEIYWNGKLITAEISPFLSSLTYTDREESESDEVTMTLDNSEGKWSSSWYPEEGDMLKLYLGYPDARMFAGEFQVDELNFSGPPDIIEIKAIAAGITKELRTRNSKAFENLTLRQVAQYFCDKHKLKLVEGGGILSKINLERKTQEEKTDLAFLSELAAEYGFIFSIRGDKMIFTSYHDLDNADSVKSIDAGLLSSYSIREKTYDTYQSAKLSTRNSRNSELVEVKVIDDVKQSKKDELLVKGSAFNKKEAEMKIKAGLYRKNRFKHIGSLIMVGDPLMVAGINFDLTGLWNISGKYHITESSHTISGSSYETSIEIRKCGYIPAPKAVPKQAQNMPQYDENEDSYSKAANIDS